MIRTALVFVAVLYTACSAEGLHAPAFIGCASEGMSGPVAAPTPANAGIPMPMLPAPVARTLSYYVSAGELAVLAPSGWHCIQIYGSGGADLFVTPVPHTPDELYADHAPLAGPAVQLEWMNGCTAGRDQVAQVAARLFPTRPDLVRTAVENDPDSAARFPHGPYRTDSVVRHGPVDVEYVTSPGHRGVGTDGRLAVGDTAIGGAAVLTAEGNVVKVAVRLPPSLAWLAQPIIAQVHAEALAVRAPAAR